MTPAAWLCMPTARWRAASVAWPSWRARWPTPDSKVYRHRAQFGPRTARRRWSTHPHFSRNRIALVHNGIIENYDRLAAKASARGYDFESQTDTEVIAHLIYLYDGDLFAAVQAAGASGRLRHRRVLP